MNAKNIVFEAADIVDFSKYGETNFLNTISCIHLQLLVAVSNNDNMANNYIETDLISYSSIFSNVYLTYALKHSREFSSSVYTRK